MSVVNKSQFPLTATLIFIAFLLRLSSENLVIAGYALLAVLALFSRSNAVLALALSWFFTMLNPGIAPESTETAIGRFAVIGAASLSVLLRGKAFGNGEQIKRIFLVTIILGASILIHSMLFSHVSEISVLKAISWSVVFLTLLGAWGALSQVAAQKLQNQLFLGLVAILLFSLPFLLMPEGYLLNGLGFQGVLNHPQTYGATMALLGAWLVGKILQDQTPSWWIVVIACVCIVMILLSEMRTAGVALVLGITCTLGVEMLMGNGRIRERLPGITSRRFHFVVFMAIGGVLISAPVIDEKIGNFIRKSDRVDARGWLDAYQTSRGTKIREMWENIERDPWFGIGFGIASYPDEMLVQRDPIFGIAVRASVEKGVVLMAVLEELGIFGFFFVLYWLWFMLRLSIKRGVLQVLMLMTIILLNFGEATLFSPGGFGLLPLILMSWAVSSSYRKKSRV